MTHHLHLTSVIPDIGPDDAAGACRTLHFAYCLCLIGNEIYDKTRHRRVEGTISDWQFLSVSDLKGCTRVGQIVACERNKAIRRINACHLAWRCSSKDHLAQCT